MAGLTKAQRAAKAQKESLEKQVEPIEQPVKITGIKQEVQQDILKIKFKLDIVRQKFGCVPTVIYLGGTQLKFTEDETIVSPKVYGILKSEGLI